MRRRIYLSGLIIFFLSLLLSCAKKESEKIHISSTSCNIFSMGDCLTPFPSDQFLARDGERTFVNLPSHAFEKTAGGVTFPVDAFKIFDGFSPATQIMAILYHPVIKSENFPDIHHPRRSLTPDGTIQIFDVESWKRVPLFAETDSRSKNEAFLLIHPLVRLLPSHTYLVVLKKGITSGKSPLSFQALRDGIITDNLVVESMRKRYDAYFSALSSRGVGRGDIFLMWDFTTGSDDFIIGRNMGKIINFLKGFPDPDSGSINLTHRSLSPDRDDGGFIYETIYGEIKVPWLLDSKDFRIKRTGDGGVDTDHYTMKEIPFVMEIPRCATSTTYPSIMIYGHGLGGSYTGLTGYHMRKRLEEWCSIGFAVNWYGADYEGIQHVVNVAVATELHPFFGFISMAERLLQGHLNFLFLLKSIPAIMDLVYPYPVTLGVDGKNKLGIYYYGGSNGGIQGATFAYTANTLYPFFRGFVLVVNGGIWSILFQRYQNWTMFENLFLAKIPDLEEVTKMAILAQFFFDFVDPITFARYYNLKGSENLSDLCEAIPLPFRGLWGKCNLDFSGVRILSQESIGDPAVSNITTEIWARTAGIPGLKHLIDSPFGIEEKEGPLTSALTQWDAHPDPLPPDSNSPISGKQTTVVKCGDRYVSAHEAPFCLDVANEQIGEFVKTGMIFQLCSGGICDPE